MDALGDRMKIQYENRTRYYLPRRTYTIIRIDGKAFHTYTKGLEKPYDKHFNQCMDDAAFVLLKEVQGGLFVYTQSDEISVVLQDFVEQDTQAWFDGNLQKICSVSSSIVTSIFASVHDHPKDLFRKAFFDSRVFTIADRNEVTNYFVWRTRDCIRNSINSLGQHYFSSKELYGENTSEVQEMLHTKGINWNDYEKRFKNGSLQNKNGYIDIPSEGLFNFYLSLLPEIK